MGGGNIIFKNQNMKNKPTCKIGLKKNLINAEVFKRELELCRNLSHENDGKCGWGKCKDCGVVPLLYKFHKGILLEEATEIKSAKEEIIK
jgi:hypothetical protein